MYNTFIAASLFVFSTTAFPATFKNIDLVSFENYNLPALSAQAAANNKVQIIVKTAMLNYPSNHPMLDSDFRQKLEYVFSMKQIDALVLTFNTRNCLQNQRYPNIFRCGSLFTGSRNSLVNVQAAQLNRQGNIVKLSDKSVASLNTDIETNLIHTTDVKNFSYTRYTARLELTLENTEILMIKENLN